ncbi:hypothetical protein [Rheinheimera sp. F8]|uniref:hypothetical protein n=1 Tax=Rheinheimera sp. F8 TaxID=1763998 RepID=UPI000744887B|nr:hypothetical protein [Rheinheimera sp. F8]ALZ75376.1 hypothetical protein ATY27_06160 [Rheinheimera sp. F8]ALZ75810.1 hypothetical protein ATY27_08545 [Rheinheimera sp. F8]
MISIYDWLNKTAHKITSFVSDKYYDVTFTSAESLDERSGWVSEFCSRVSHKLVSVEYNPDLVKLKLGDSIYNLADIASIPVLKGKYLLDATSLALPEILQLFRIFDMKKVDFDVLYVQPTGYREHVSTDVSDSKVFDLSDDGHGLQLIPPFVGTTADSQIFVCLGFEGHRLGTLIHCEEYITDKTFCLIGVPAFKSGWENITLSNNSEQLSKLLGYNKFGIRYAGANDPISTYESINKVYCSLSYERKILCLVPIGTKPATIAAAQFAINNKNVIVAFDFVRKKKNRTEGSDIVHIWKFKVD